MARTLRDMTAEKFWRNPDVVGFMDKVRANPEDDVCRLIFCDWLEDTADGEIDLVHAAYIRNDIAHNRAAGIQISTVIPGIIRGRVFSGLGPLNTHEGTAPLVRNVRVPEVGIIAHVERGLVSRVTVNLGSHPETVLADLVAAMVGQYRRWETDWEGPLLANLQHGKIVKPLAMWHPYYVELSDPAQLQLDTFRGERVTHRGPAVVATYLGIPHRFEMSHLQALEAVKPGAAGNYVVTETITAHWRYQFRERLAFPVQVRLTDNLVKHVCDRVRQVQPL